MPGEDGHDVIYLISDRKSGKSSIAGLIAAFTAIFGTWGDEFSVLVVAPTIRQAKPIFRSCRAMLGYFPGALLIFSDNRRYARIDSADLERL